MSVQVIGRPPVHFDELPENVQDEFGFAMFAHMVNVAIENGDTQEQAVQFAKNELDLLILNRADVRAFLEDFYGAWPPPQRPLEC